MGQDRNQIKFEKDYVEKTFSDHYSYKNELRWLKALSQFDRSPNILEFDELQIKMSYVGEVLSLNNLPEDWHEQCHTLLNGLQSYKCSHNDLKGDNLTVLDGKIHVIDFETTSELYQREILLTDELNLFLWIASLKRSIKYVELLNELKNEARVITKWM